MIIHETMDEYLERPAVSASMSWDIVNECPAYAYVRSPFCPKEKRVRHAATEQMDFGTIAHLAVLEDHLLLDRTLIVSEKDWRSKSAKEMREVAVGEGKIAILLRDFERIGTLRKSLQEDEDAAPLLFGKGESEVTYAWEWSGVPCKARIDRLADDGDNKILVHLKTSRSANPLAFANVGASLGYALACAWYLDGWYEQGTEMAFDSYRIVVVSSHPPHIATVGCYDAFDLEQGRDRYQEALVEFCKAVKTGVWPKYNRGAGDVTIFRQPAWYRRHMSDLEGISRE